MGAVSLPSGIGGLKRGLTGLMVGTFQLERTGQDMTGEKDSDLIGV